jgi:hypothetical protein
VRETRLERTSFLRASLSFEFWFMSPVSIWIATTALASDYLAGEKLCKF